jgi:hypothetical protein
MQNIVKNTEENFGALVGFQFVPVDDVISIPEAVNKVITDPVVLKEDKTFYKGDKRLESASFEENPTQGRDGLEYSIKFSAFVPGDSADLKNLFEQMMHKRYLVLCNDANNKMRLLGTIENGLRFGYKFSINPKVSGGKGYEIVFNHKTTEPAPFYQSSFEVATAPDVFTEPLKYVYDGSFEIRNSTVKTKKLRFDVAGVGENQTRTIIMPDEDVDLGAMLNNTLIEVILPTMNTLISSNALKPGRFYKILNFNFIVQAISTNTLSPLGIRINRRVKFETVNYWDVNASYEIGNIVTYNGTDVYTCIQAHDAEDVSDWNSPDIEDYWEYIDITDDTYYTNDLTKIFFRIESGVPVIYNEQYFSGDNTNLLKNWATNIVFIKDSFRLHENKLLKALISHKTTTYAADLAAGRIAVVIESTGGSAAWGAITGTLSSQTDLIAALAEKLNIGAYIGRGFYRHNNITVSVTGSTLETVMLNIPIVGGDMGLNGKLIFEKIIGKTGTNAAYTTRAYLSTVETNLVGNTGTPVSATLIATRSTASTILNGGVFTRTITNKNNESLNSIFPATTDALNDNLTSTAARQNINFNTSVNFWLVITIALISASDIGSVLESQTYIEKPLS